MIQFLDAIQQFPTVVFTVLLVLVLVYWLFVIFGALDIELFDLGDMPDVEGAADGAGDAADGLADGIEAQADGLSGLIQSLGLGGVPVTVSLSLLIFFAWSLSYFSTSLLARLELPSLLASGLAVGVGVVTLGLAIVPTTLAIRPLRPVFRTQQAVGLRSFVGRICSVTTSRVTDRFGQAEIDDGGAGVLVEVRCPEPNTLTRDSRALVYDYDCKLQVFLVEPLAGDLDGLEGS